jgi:hypothetical protein
MKDCNLASNGTEQSRDQFQCISIFSGETEKVFEDSQVAGNLKWFSSTMEGCVKRCVSFRYVKNYEYCLQAKAVNMVANGTAPKVPQSEEGASYEPSLSKEELQMVSIIPDFFVTVWHTSLVRSIGV